MTGPTKKTKTVIRRQNVLESLKDLGAEVGTQTGDLLKSTSEDFFKELLGMEKPTPKRSGNLNPGESLQISDALSGKEEENKKLRAQISLERQLSSDEKRVSSEKSQELKNELQALMLEVQRSSASMQNLAEVTQVTMMAAPIEPGLYHISFFQNFLNFLESFRKRIDLTIIWLQSSNKRAEKKNYWSQYKKKGTSFLLSGESYSQRSAG
jgi:hypothetical protein